MITVRPARERGHAEHGWLSARHTFSFAGYYDPDHTGFRALRVLNEDRVEAGHGFPSHGHRDMEILTYVLEGELAHTDSLGGSSVLRPGDVQLISAGTGVVHGEANPSSTRPVHLLQIWLLPERTGLTPTYAQQAFSEAERRGRLRVLATRGGAAGERSHGRLGAAAAAGEGHAATALDLHQDATVYAALLEPGMTVSHRVGPGRHAWLQVARGAVRLNGRALSAGDGAGASEEALLAIAAQEPSEVLLFDLA
ncbi:MAG: pirin family protein [Planctomycetes bacterium]|nr:pirin family protein [Planctomycetota bacterium]